MIQLSNTEILSLEFLSLFGFSATVTLFAFINCYFGSKLKFESENIATAAYFSNWENLGRRSYQVKKEILMIISRSLKPSVVQIGNMIDLDLPTFATVAKASYSYYTFLSQTQDK